MRKDLYKILNNELKLDFESDKEVNMNFGKILLNNEFEEDFIERYLLTDNKVDNYFIAVYQKLSEEFLRKNLNYFFLYDIIIHQKLSEEFIEEISLSTKFDSRFWAYVNRYQNLSEEFIERHLDKLTWNYTSEYQKLSESFIEKYKNRLNWSLISSYQILSEDLIERYQDRINWERISRHQKLSREFIEKYKDKINIKDLNKNVLIRTDIGRDWFVAYTDYELIKLGDIKENYYLFSSFNNSSFPSLVKIKIYYKDLIFTGVSKKIEIIRELNKFKIKCQCIK